MQNSDASLAPIPEPKNKEPQAETRRHASDKNRVDTIARSSEPGRHGEDSVYVPPSQLHPERSTAQTAFDNALTASTGGSYGLDHFMDKGSVAESAAGRPLETTSIQTKSNQMDESIRRQPYRYALGALGIGFLLGRFFPLPSRT
ncbi:MAG TPA: hypothetical protein VFO10_04725 [Oligoflexus sp.]|uniref:hypothetical protein n=1 Tax=Oligoflexus sp. TaxID=1971216 RepID=UPI002D7FA3D6|nr:hypothetical protein [Oligoflexus sp.]HET9236527.1 hypothetical protein [Oligoflexus sp.]